MANLIDEDHPFYCGLDSMAAPHLPVGSPEREALFAGLRETFVEDWEAAERAVKEAKRERLGDLYFVGAGDAVKIGHSKNFDQRLRHLQTHRHQKVECLLLLKGGGWRESELHRRFKAHRLHGEWFKRCPEIEAEIAALPLIGDPQS